MSNFDDLVIDPYSVIFHPSIPASQIPYRYQIMRERAKLERCCYWRENEDNTSAEDQAVSDGTNNVIPADPLVYEFVALQVDTGAITEPVRTPEEISAGHREMPAEKNQDEPITVMGGWAHEINPSFYMEPYTFKVNLINGASSVPTKCKKGNIASEWHQGEDGFPPCNGAKTECPFYTGPKFKYIKDEHIFVGQEIRGEQVQELRSLMKSWTRFENPRDVWNQTFETPDIFARSFHKETRPNDDEEDRKDKRVYDQVELEEGEEGRTAIISQTTRVKWDFEGNGAEYTTELTRPEGTAQEGEDGVGAPEFYTLIPNLGRADVPNLSVMHPRDEGESNSEDPDLDRPIEFLYEHSHPYSDILYVAGQARPNLLIFIINTTIHDDVPFDEEPLTTSGTITPIIEDLVEKSFEYPDRLEGFNMLKADSSGFWEEFFVDLVPGENKIAVLAQVNGIWETVRLKIMFKFYHVEFIQDGYNGSAFYDESPTLDRALGNLAQHEDIIFRGYDIGNSSAIISKVYHYFTHRRDLEQFCTDEERPHSRTFIITKEETGEIEVDWYRLSKCNQFMVEVKNVDIPTVIPMGLDRSMEVRRAKLVVQEDVGESGHGEEGTEETEIEMEVVPFRGRNVQGIAMPTRFFKVKPVGNVDIGQISISSKMYVELEIYKSLSPTRDQIESLGGIDYTVQILEEFRSSEIENLTIGSVPLNYLTPNSEYKFSFAHHPEIEGLNVNAGTPNKFDMSYVVEISTPDGHPIGRKWIYGVGEVIQCFFRAVEIRYIWCSEATTLIKLIPDYEKFGDYADDAGDLGEAVVEERSGVCRRARCGDHETSDFIGGGPSFYDYESCEQPFYFNRDVARWLYQPVPDVEPVDEKYRAPDRYDYRTLEHHVFGFLIPDCFFEWSLGTLHNVGSKFVGYSRERGPISLFIRPKLFLMYRIRGWDYPPFGNRGREIFRIFKTAFFREYFVQSSNDCGISVILGWMPMLPYASSATFMSDDRPRFILDQVRNLPGTELERFKWSEVFTVRNTLKPTTQNRPGLPVQWPKRGFYHNFKKKDIVWVWEEAETNIERGDYNVVTGVNLGKPSTYFRGDLLVYNTEDVFDRPINLYPDEGEIYLKLHPERYSRAGVYEERAFLQLNEGVRLYFNEYTGKIENKKHNDSRLSTPPDQLYAMSGINLIANEYEPFLEEAHEYPVGNVGDPAPEEFADLDEYISVGNLIIDGNTAQYFLSQGDVSGISEEMWAGFFKALNVNRIIPKYLPRSPINIASRDDLFPFISITPMPDINPGLNLGRDFSGAYLPQSRVDFFYGNGGGDFDWQPIDPTLPEDHEDQPAQLEGIRIVALFDRPLMVSKIELIYEVYGGVALGAEDPEEAPEVPPQMDPSLEILLTNTSQAITKEIIDKPEYNTPPRFIPPGPGQALEREYTFYGEIFRDKQVYDRLEINIGPRREETGFRIKEFRLTADFIKETVEAITINERKYLAEIEEEHPIWPYSYPAQDDQENEEWYLLSYAEDVSDIKELQGIAEFWQPARASLARDDIVGTKGKLRRQLANGWDSLDIQLELGEISLKSQYPGNEYGGAVTDHENKQRQLMLDAVDFAIDMELPDEISYLYLQPDETNILDTWVSQNSTISSELPFELGSEIIFDAGFTELRRSINENIFAAAGDMEPGWQAEGFWACFGDYAKTLVRIRPGPISNCFGAGATSLYNVSQGVCGENVGDPMNSDDPNYFGGISIGDLGFYMTRRMILSGGDAAKASADPRTALYAYDGGKYGLPNSEEGSRQIDHERYAIAGQGAINFRDSHGLPPPTQDIRDRRT